MIKEQNQAKESSMECQSHEMPNNTLFFFSLFYLFLSFWKLTDPQLPWIQLKISQTFTQTEATQQTSNATFHSIVNYQERNNFNESTVSIITDMKKIVENKLFKPKGTRREYNCERYEKIHLIGIAWLMRRTSFIAVTLTEPIKERFPYNRRRCRRMITFCIRYPSPTWS